MRGQRRGVELKTAGYPDESWGEPGSDVIPLDYALQCRHYMAVCDVDVWDLGVLFLNTRNYATYTLYRDRATEDATNAYLLEWWDRYIVHGEPLPLDASDSCAEGLAVKHGKPRPEKVKATPELEAMLTQWQQADAAVKGWADQKALLENSIRDAMGATEVLTSAIGSVHWKERAGRPYTNFTGILKDLVERHGVDERVVAELRKLHTTESPGYRHFQIYPRNETAK